MKANFIFENMMSISPTRLEHQNISMFQSSQRYFFWGKFPCGHSGTYSPSILWFYLLFNFWITLHYVRKWGKGTWKKYTHFFNHFILQVTYPYHFCSNTNDQNEVTCPYLIALKFLTIKWIEQWQLPYSILEAWNSVYGWVFSKFSPCARYYAKHVV